MRKLLTFRGFRALLKDRSAVAATEFAILAPVLMVMTVGAFEAGRYAMYSRKMTLVAATMGQLVSQSSADFTARDTHFVYDSAMLVFPQVLPDASRRTQNWWDVLQPTFSSVVFKPTVPGCTSGCNYNAFVAWTAGNVRRPCGQLSKVSDTAAPSYSGLPASMYGSSSVIAVDVRLTYKPLIESAMMPEITLMRTSFFAPRYVPVVNYTSAASDQYFVTKCPGV